jgi:hypothetical protein
MPSPDPAKAIKTALVTEWATAHPTWTATLHVDDDYKPTAGSPTLLVADDGGPRVVGDSWTVGKTPRKPSIRFTAYAVGRDEALGCVDAAVDFILDHRPVVISRFEDVPNPFVTRDRATSAFLASITVPVIVRQTA